MPFRRASLSEKTHRQRRSTDNANTLGLEIGHYILQSRIIDRVVAIGKYDIQCSRRNPIENISKYLQRKSRNPNETSLPCFLQFLECRNCLINNLNKAKQLAPLEIQLPVKLQLNLGPLWINNLIKQLCISYFCNKPDPTIQIQYHDTEEYQHNQAATFPNSHQHFWSLSQD